MQVEDNRHDKEDAEQHIKVDLSTFNGNFLEVTCGSFKGTLHKKRFATGKCMYVCFCTSVCAQDNVVTKLEP